MLPPSLPNKSHTLPLLLVVLLAAFLPLAAIIMKVMAATDGVFIYPVDDAFIHLQIARSLAEYQTWGINAQEFASASSSPLYTVILGLSAFVTGPQMLLPFIINCLAAALLIILVQRWLMSEGVGTAGQLLILLILVFITPFLSLVLSGMEHVLQCLFSFLFIWQFSSWLSRPGKNALTARLVIYGMLAVSIRYEGLFIIGMACLLLACRKRFGAALALGFLSALPVIIFGIYSVAEGSYFLPNSVLVKSEAAQFSIRAFLGSLAGIVEQKFLFSITGISLLATQKLLVLLPLAYLAARKYLNERKDYVYIILILTGTVFLHLALADTGKFYRYEAWLIMLSVLIISTIAYRYGRMLIRELSGLALVLAFCVLAFLSLPVFLRTAVALSKTERSCINIYEQQYQMGRFLQKYHDREVVAANDIGAVSYFTHCTIVDLWGLGTNEIARSKKGGYWTAPFLDSFSRAKKARIAVIYDSWIGNSRPPSWIKLASWKIQNNVVCGDDTVSFYAIDAGISGQLLNNLKDYEKNLPEGVEVVYY